MGVRGMGEASQWALAMASAVSELRETHGMTVQELAALIDKDPSYLYARLKGRAPFNFNDWDSLSQAFGMHPQEIARIASRYAAAGELGVGPMVDVDSAELGRRLRLLEAAPRPSGTDFDLDILIEHAAEREISLSGMEWERLREGTGVHAVRVRVMGAVAEYTGVPVEFLTDLSDEGVREITEAQLELRCVIREVGAESMLARAVGDVSPHALRAIAASLRAAQSHSGD